jgi:hypothetical protein
LCSPSTFSRQIKLSNLTSTSELKLQPLIHSDIVIGVACFTTLLLLFSQEDISIAIDILFFCMIIITYLLKHYKNIILTGFPPKIVSSFFLLYNSAQYIHKSSTSFHPVDSLTLLIRAVRVPLKET